MKKRKYFFLVVVWVSLSMMACHHLPGGIREIPAAQRPNVSVEIQRYEKALFKIDTTRFQSQLESLKKEFPYFLAGDLHDSANLKQLYAYVTDTQLIKLYHQTLRVFPDLNPEEKQLSTAFSYLKYYYPNYNLPKVYSYVSGIYFEHPVLKRNNLIIIALDDYLGRHFAPYSQLHIPRYHQRCMERNFIPVDVLKAMYINDFKKPAPNRTLLDKMIEAGKQLYFLDAMLPTTPDSTKIGYSTRQLKWMNAHKRDVWAVLVKNHLIYSVDYMALMKLTQDGPFTEGFSQQSPPRMAAWFGWQIVRTYMQKHPDKTPEDLFRIKDAQHLLQASGYKP